MQEQLSQIEPLNNPSAESQKDSKAQNIITAEEKFKKDAIAYLHRLRDEREKIMQNRDY
ncbi:hypothetical protein IMZ68_03260 [Candidatus Bathyarchaeota archaeon]|nr:hypothetical protein [Candidatus Bathyarchaeota archaeon]